MKINNQEIILNKEQEAAVLHDNGPLLVIAGAGSGKTRVITARIAYLMVERAVPASAIVALTFTNKAAQEMKERIATFIGSQQPLPFVGTFHSYCVQVLKKNAHRIGTHFLTILDEDDQKKLLHDIMQRSNTHTHITPRQAAYYISQVKNKIIESEQVSSHLFDHPLMPALYKAYEEEKRASRALDFDDLLLETVRLFKKDHLFKQSFQSMIRHVLVDEYQDTNIVQHELLRQIALSSHQFTLDSLCAVGDEDQSIYSWRGANVTNMLNFTKDFPTTTILKIEQNYRSVQPILDTANHVIQHNTQRNPKKLWSSRAASGRVIVLQCVSEFQEADAIVQLIKVTHRHHQTNDIAILYRTHAQSRIIEEALLKNSIAYTIIGGIQFYERKEIKDLLAYLKLLVNPFDRASMFRIINTPTRGFGPKFEEHLYTILNQEPSMSLHQACARLLTEFSGSKQTALSNFLAIFEGIAPHDSPSRALQLILDRTQFMHFIKKSYERDEAQERIENIQELMDAIKYVEARNVTTITAFLDEVTLMQEKLAATNETQHTVLLMTLHAAKGLEFNTVILAGLEQGVVPTARALYDESTALEEERRLFYVGITRAKERLLITHSKFRYTHGRMSDQIPSQFLNELPSLGITREDCTYWNMVRFAQYFAHWLAVQYDVATSFENNQRTFATIVNNRIAARTKATAPTTTFTLDQSVTHAKYGTGTIQHIEKKHDTEIITVRFKSGTKKIVAQFLKEV